jgi:hypothetical protein
MLFLEVPVRERRRWVRSLRAKRQPRNRVADGVIDVSRPTEGDKTFMQSLVSWLGGAAIALLVPFVILLLGLPIALAIRLLLEVSRWLVSVIF